MGPFADFCFDIALNLTVDFDLSRFDQSRKPRPREIGLLWRITKKRFI